MQRAAGALRCTSADCLLGHHLDQQQHTIDLGFSRQAIKPSLSWSFLPQRSRSGDSTEGQREDDRGVQGVSLTFANLLASSADPGVITLLVDKFSQGFTYLPTPDAGTLRLLVRIA